MPRFRLLALTLVAAQPWQLAAAQAPAPSTGQSCVDVRIGMDQYYDCINRQLQEATRTRPFTTRDDAPYSAASPAPAVGGFNQAASREQLGTSFGHSAIPQRPPPPVFTSPLVGHH